MNSSWIEEAHADALEMDADEVSAKSSQNFKTFESIAILKSYLN
jgi:hypothetical protein